jgi:hypothetical protein
MNVEIGAETALFPEKEYINGIAVAVQLCTLETVECTKVKTTLNSAAYVEGRQIASIPSRNFRRNMRADCASFS